MLYERNKILADLRKYVLSATLKTDFGVRQEFRITLMPEHLPARYIQEQAGEISFHQQNPKTIRCWDIKQKKWLSFDIFALEYCEDVTDRF